MTIAELKQFQDKTVVLRLTDGEVSTVKVRFVDFEYEDIIVDVLETNRPDTYKDMATSAYAIRAEHVASITEITK
jgi:hypothetical protein